MTIQIVPVKAEPAQTLSVQLAGQQVQLRLNSRGGTLFADVFVSDSPVVRARRCMDRVPLVMDKYHGFVGDLYFEDTQGISDPEYSGLGSRFLLCYLPLAAGQ